MLLAMPDRVVFGLFAVYGWTYRAHPGSIANANPDLWCELQIF